MNDAHHPNGTVAAAPALSEREKNVIIAGVLLSMLLAALDQTIVAPAMPTIGHALGQADYLPWIVTGYLLTATAMAPLYGKISDIYGRRPTIFAAIAIFLLGSLVSALAPNMPTLIVGRLVQGLGGGGLFALTQTVIGDLVPPRERARYAAWISGTWAVASIAGPLLGGTFAQHLHWSLIFWINVPLGLVAAAMSYRALRRLPAHHHPHRLDILGAALMCAATVALLLALSWGGTHFRWLSLPILGLLALSVLLWVGFGLRVATASEPLMPVSILANQVVRTGVPAAAFAMGTLVGLSIQMPLYLEGVMGLTASESGVALIPLMAGVVVGATGAGKVMGSVTHYKRLPLVGLVASMAALSVLAFWPLGLPVIVVGLAMGVTGIGLGTVLPVSTVAIQNAVPLPQMGTATGVVNLFRSLGGAVLTAGFGAIVIGMSGIEASALLERLLEGRAQVAPLADAFRWVFVAAAASLAVSLVAMIAMEERPLRSGHAPSPLPE